MQIDWPRFGTAVAQKRAKSRKGLRRFSYELGLNHSTLNRVERGFPCTVEVFLTLIGALGRSPSYYRKQEL